MNKEQPATTQTAYFLCDDIVLLKQKMLNWVSRFNIFCFMDNCGSHFQPNRFECLLAVGSAQSLTDDLSNIDAFVSQGRWCFGHLAYDLKRMLHNLSGGEKSKVGFPLFHFFLPQIVITIKGQEVCVEAAEPEIVWRELNEVSPIVADAVTNVHLQPKISRLEYLQTVKQLQQHILRGDCYEINFCQEFFAKEVYLNPVAVFNALCKTSPAPFAALYRLNDQFLISVSPERFLMKQGDKLIAQPMKGTARRHLSDEEQDAVLKQGLYNSAKDRSENVMIVDLLRNDLSQVCQRSSVKVDELFGIYSFPQVHQMVSTISGEMKPEVSFTQILKALFPMGSMTGAPKRRVMELIHQYEPFARGLFSGSVGYITPEGDFDFNVIIRSVLYDAGTGYVSCPVGSGITFYSNAESEWEECLVKVEAIRKVLGGG